MIVPKSGGKLQKKQFYKSNMHIVERLLNKLFVSGHKGKKHKLSSGQNVGKTMVVWNIIENAFDIIEKKTTKNPVEVLVRAIENSAPIEEVLSFQKGGSFTREPVLTSPQRRVDLALRFIVQTVYSKSKMKKKKAYDALADELIAAYKNETASAAVSEKIRREKEAHGAR
ncbi:MAG: 30S ribosomal protein S7 [DPANN group archaeon]|nr:30S ribosomal protein S7 [DPANN group archaeon]